MDLNRKDEITPDEIVNLLTTNGENVLLTAPGGLGKSWCLKEVAIKLIEKGYSTWLTATTGVAAINLSVPEKKLLGTTLHSWAGIGVGTDPEEKLYQTIIGSDKYKKRWLGIQILIVDEVSMLSAKLLDLLDRLARRVRKINYPFGNIRLLFSGDFLQLPPVKEKWVFESDVWAELYFHPVFLTVPKRYTDMGWYEILSRIRIGKPIPSDIEFLKTKVTAYQKFIDGLAGDIKIVKPTILYSKKVDVEAYNDAELSKLPGKAKEFVANDEFKPHTKYGKMDKYITILEDAIPKYIQLKVGAQVMLRANLDFENELVNGSRGVITDILGEGCQVKWVNGKTSFVTTHVWKQEDKDARVVRSQIPLICAFSYTTHKSQGATLDFVVCDLGPDVFLAGQAYVALSRVKSRDGLFLSNFLPTSIMADKVALDFINKLQQQHDNIKNGNFTRKCDLIERGGITLSTTEEQGENALVKHKVKVTDISMMDTPKINIHLCITDGKTEMHFKVKPETLFSSITKQYAVKQVLDSDVLSFSLNGKNIVYQHTDTISSLGIKDNCEIKASKISTQPKSKVYKCCKCKKTLDIEHEMQNNISRYSSMRQLGPLVETIKLELMEAIEKKEYTCEKCLFNE